MNYNWQQPDWPRFRYDLVDIQDTLFAIAEKMGHMSGLLKGLPEPVQTETVLGLMVSEAVKTSAYNLVFTIYPHALFSMRSYSLTHRHY